ncbi:MAG TPA: hypothetical protein PKZ40_06030 [Anaerolineaceae bacterium]|nr:hypothetical protein [Anaerolineaceae bacterium]HPK27280.1 hypothetical protein [Anaerolineaceae bacterium]
MSVTWENAWKSNQSPHGQLNPLTPTLLPITPNLLPITYYYL